LTTPNITPDEKAILAAMRGLDVGMGEILRLHAWLDPAVNRLAGRGWIERRFRSERPAEDSTCLYLLVLTRAGKQMLDDVPSDAYAGS
jgi:hypothetical protein